MEGIQDSQKREEKKASVGNRMQRVTSARKSLKEETLLVPHITSSQPSSVSTTAMMDTPLTAQTCIHQTATHPKPLSIFLLSLIMAQKCSLEIPGYYCCRIPTPHQATLNSGGHSWDTHVPASPPLSEHHWEAFCILCRRETCYLQQQSPKTVLFVFASSFLSHSSHALTAFRSLACPPLPICP